MNSGSNLTQVTLVDASSTSLPNGSTTIASSSMVAADHSSFTNYRLVASDGTVLSTASENTSGQITFNVNSTNSSVQIPVSSYGVVSLVADANAYPYASSSGVHAYWVSGYQYTNAAGSQTSSTTAVGSLFTIYRTSLHVAQGPTFYRPGSISGGAGQIVGEFSFTAGSGYDAIVKNVDLSTGGSIVSEHGSHETGLYDAAAPSALLASSTSDLVPEHRPSLG